MSMLPTAEELGSLSSRAVAAYAARCARRVRPLFQLDAGEASKYEREIDLAIKQAEMFAGGRVFLDFDRLLVGGIGNTVSDVALRGGDYSRNAAARVGLAASRAAGAAWDSSGPEAQMGVAGAMAIDSAAAAARESVDAARIADPETEATTLEAARHDYERLRSLPRNDARDGMGEPVDVSEQGPLGLLWPGDVPNWINGGERVKLAWR